MPGLFSSEYKNTVETDVNETTRGELDVSEIIAKRVSVFGLI